MAGDPERVEGEAERKEGGAQPERAPLGILFLAAALALMLVLTLVGLLAWAALAPRSARPAELGKQSDRAPARHDDARHGTARTPRRCADTASRAPDSTDRNA
jgi:hypothetical protein